MFNIKKATFFFMIMLMFLGKQNSLLASHIYTPNSTPEQHIFLLANPQMETFTQSLGIQDLNTSENKSLEELYWASSFLIPGLGQLLLGESRGMLFFLGISMNLILVALLFALRESLVINSYPHNGKVTSLNPYPTSVELGVLLAFMSLYTWNVIDAYMLNLEVTHKKTLKDEYSSFNKKLKNVLIFANENKIDIRNNGINFQTRLTTF